MIFKEIKSAVIELSVLVMSITFNSTELVADENPNILTLNDVNIVVQNYSKDKSVKVLSYEIYEYSELRLGFSGGYKTLEVTFKKSNQTTSETIKLFVKTMPYECKEQSDFFSNEGIFRTESKFYHTIVPQLTDCPNSEKWHATCYLAKKDTIVMEDLSLQNYIVLEKFFENFMVIKSVIASLARFHSSTIIAEFRLSQESEHPVTLKDIYPDFFQENMFTRTGMLAYWIYAGADLTCIVAESLNCYSNKIREAYEQTFDLAKPSEIHRNVICHGSLWCNNMMFAGNEPLKNCVLIDFQFVKYAPLVIDLLQFLHLNSSRKFRDEHEPELLEFYHSVLEETVRSNDPTNSIKVPTLEEIIFGMKDLRIFGLVVATIYFPVVYMDSNLSSELFEISFDKYAFGNRFNATLTHMKDNPFFKKVIEEAVMELAEIVNAREI